MFKKYLPQSDIIICCDVESKGNHVFIDEELYGLVRRGAIIVDLATEVGGNCFKTKINDKFNDDANDV